jgi:hypothetical protein
MSMLAPSAFVYLLSALYAHMALPLNVATFWAKLWLVSNAVVAAACIAAGFLAESRILLMCSCKEY